MRVCACVRVYVCARALVTFIQKFNINIWEHMNLSRRKSLPPQLNQTHTSHQTQVMSAERQDMMCNAFSRQAAGGASALELMYNGEMTFCMR